MAIELVKNAQGKIERVDAWGNRYEAIPKDLHRAWLLKSRTIFPYCLKCWGETGQLRTVETSTTSFEHGRWEMMYTVCGVCLHGALRLANVCTSEMVHLANNTDNPLFVLRRPGAREVQTTIHRGFVWWKLSLAGFATMFYYSQFGAELYGALGTRDPLGMRNIDSRPLGMLLNGVMLKALGAVEKRSNKLASTVKHFAGGEVVAGAARDCVYMGLPKHAVKTCKENFGKFSFAEAMDRYVHAYKLANSADGREFWINTMDGLFAGNTDPALDADIDALVEANILTGPFARSTKKIDAEVNNVLASLGKDKGLNLEMIHRLYGRI